MVPLGSFLSACLELFLPIKSHLTIRKREDAAIISREAISLGAVDIDL
jgi:hypothetical protein